jgi:hypothetical protein
VDFVSPENVGLTQAHRERLRQADLALPSDVSDGPAERRCQEKLQSQLILLRTALAAARTLQQQQQQQ